MELSSKIASDITVFSKYAKFIPEAGRRENWGEIVDRYETMMTKKYHKLKEEIKENCQFIRDKKVLPSMRMLQFAGKAIERNNSRGYNCAYAAASYKGFFKELMFLLLGGTGVGYSVQKRHISQLPTIKKPGRERRFVIGDSIEGWADAVNTLMRAFFDSKPLPRFDYDDIRPKGERLKTAGGKAPGPGPLRVCLDKILSVLETKEEGSQLTSVEVCDIACIVADAVLSGGIRRSALICLYDLEDKYMQNYKSGKWYEAHPERARVNVSAVALRSEVTKEQFQEMWSAVENSGSGEPGISWTADKDLGTNPCHEIALRHKEFCNLTTINFSTVEDDEDFVRRAKVAAFLGTLQAGFTDFHYLSVGWEENCQDEALLGVSITGIGDVHGWKNFDFEKAARAARKTNKETAEKIGIKPAARVTAIKPEGTSSMVLGTASGVHGRHSAFYIRRFRFKKNESIARYLATRTPPLVVQDLSDPDGVILELPIASPEGSILREERAEDLCKRVKYLHEKWISPGHRSGANTHNVSATISVRPVEWANLGEWFWKNRESYNGLSVLPYSDHTYTQPPFEDVTRRQYEEMARHLSDINLDEVNEEEDNTEPVDNVACAGGKCDL